MRFFLESFSSTKGRTRNPGKWREENKNLREKVEERGEIMAYKTRGGFENGSDGAHFPAISGVPVMAAAACRSAGSIPCISYFFPLTLFMVVGG